MGDRKSILVVDDELVMRAFLRRVLLREGCEVYCASGGEMGLESLRRRRFDLVLLDLRMPGLGGLETLRAIRKAGSRVPVILMGGILSEDDIADASVHGLSGTLKKPIGLDELRAKVLTAAADGGA